MKCVSFPKYLEFSQIKSDSPSILKAVILEIQTFLFDNLFIKLNTLPVNYFCIDRCRHGAIAKFFEDDKPPCDKCCDFCKNRSQCLLDIEHFKKGVYSSSHPHRHQGRTMISVEKEGVDGELYGGGRKGAKV